MEYQKINENLSIRTYMQDFGLEEYTLYKHMPPYDKTMGELYTHPQQAMGDQLAFSIVKDQEVPFTRAKILRAIHIAIEILSHS